MRDHASPAHASIATVFAPAKVNLSLRVLGRLENGYHALQSLVAFADTGDQLRLAKAETTSYASTMQGDDNLVFRAHQALEKALGAPLHVAIELQKNLPIAAGLGGGSSDAAACLRGLMGLFDIDPSQIDVAALALSLGADVPVCLGARPAFMGGLGEQVTPLTALPEADIVLVNPRQPLSTAQVFAALNASTEMRPAAPVPQGFAQLDDLISFLQAEGNDLQSAAIGLLPAIADCLSALKQAAGGQGYVAMSGSGASCFCLCAPASGAQIAAAYRAQRPDDWVEAGRLIGPGDTEIDQLGQ